MLNSEKLYAITVIFNPEGYDSRYRLYHEFAKRLKAFHNVELITVELVIGNQPYQVTSRSNPNNIQLTTNQSLWYKENLINIAFSYLPSDAKYVAWLDADIQFLNPNWVEDTIYSLEHDYDFVQLFSEYIDLNPSYEVINKLPSYIKMWQSNHLNLKDNQYDSKFIGATGLAWAARKDVLDCIGGIPDHEIVGSGDWTLSYLLTNKADSLKKSWHTSGQTNLIDKWNSLINAYVNKRVGYINGTVVHNWHGAKSKRGYNWRWNILKNHQFDPTKDLYKDLSGIYHISPDKLTILDDLESYFESRDEDSLDV